ncbi:uncharacterized protein LOC133317646 [Gastrolobium bilobum]|uniref:uncharacterized protein LOC133317646 n=1 Tax=Gastrolobium bilobum TaxID=150636 RepID=UPI002AAFE4FC|nr:uncharacterized protein LOC133317646 [Gastrolobium bilobum]
MKEGSSKGRNVCLTVTGVVVAIVLVLGMLALVFRPQELTITVDSVELQNMDVGFNVFKMSVDLNVTLDVNVSVKNTNEFGFKSSEGSAQLNYRGQLIGEAPIPSGEVSPGETKGLNLTLTVMANRFLSNYSQISSDVTSGALPLNTLIKISGEVNILGFIKFHVETSSSCSFKLNISNKTVEENECQSKSKF